MVVILTREKSKKVAEFKSYLASRIDKTLQMGYENPGKECFLVSGLYNWRWWNHWMRNWKSNTCGR
jgi:hypothetical protein